MATVCSDAGEFAEMVRTMRAAQKRYFRTRSQADLAESKRWEKKVDDALAAPPPEFVTGDLFAELEPDHEYRPEPDLPA